MKCRLAFVLPLLLAGAVSASAQVAYRHGAVPNHGLPYGVPNADDDMSYDSHPAFVLSETPYGPRLGVVARCTYPNGWNSTDFVRDINGTPAGLDHTCPEPYSYGHGVRARY